MRLNLVTKAWVPVQIFVWMADVSSGSPRLHPSDRQLNKVGLLICYFSYHSWGSTEWIPFRSVSEILVTVLCVRVEDISMISNEGSGSKVATGVCPGPSRSVTLNMSRFSRNIPGMVWVRFWTISLRREVPFRIPLSIPSIPFSYHPFHSKRTAISMRGWPCKLINSGKLLIRTLAVSSVPKTKQYSKVNFVLRKKILLVVLRMGSL